MIDIIGILQGMNNAVFVKEQIELIAQERLEHCNECEHYSPNIKNKGLNILYPYKYCDICKCNMYLKTRQLSAQCPIGERGRPKFPGTPKWTAYTTDAKLSEKLLEIGLKDEITEYKTNLSKNIDEHGD